MKLTLLDIDSKEPISGIQVSVNNRLSYVSDNLGQVEISNLTTKDQLNIVSKFYESKEIYWTSDLKTISLKKIAKSLKETQIVGKKPQIKLEAGKTILDASQVTFQQGTLKDLLQQIPGVILDNNNNITVKGKTLA